MVKITIMSEVFHQALGDVVRAVSTSTPMPVLTGVHLVATEEGLTLVGSDSDLIITRELPAEAGMLDVEQPGAIVLPARYLAEIVKKLSGPIHLQLIDDMTADIRCGEIKTKLKGFPSDDYPKLPVMEESETLQLDASKWMEMLKQTVFAVSKSEAKPVLTGVHISMGEGRLTSVATDSHRLAYRETKIDQHIDRACIVPYQAIGELIKLWDGKTEVVEVAMNEHHIHCRLGETSLYSRLIDGKYPNVSGLIPEGSETLVKMETKQLLKGVDRACLFAGEWKNHNVYITIHDGRMKLSSAATQLGNIEESQRIMEIEGTEEMKMTLDGKYLMEALRSVKEETVTLQFGGIMKPVIIRPEGNATHLQLISPVRAY